MCNWKFVQTDLKFREIHACTHTQVIQVPGYVYTMYLHNFCTISTTDVQKIDDNKL